MLGRVSEKLFAKGRWVPVILALVLVIGGVGFGVMAAPELALAQDSTASDNALALAEETGLATTDIRTFIANIVRVFFGLIGITMVGLMIYAGFLWMSAGGNPEQIKKSQQMIKNAAIGLVIIMSAYAIAEFIFRVLLGGLGGGLGGPGAGNGVGNTFGLGAPGSDALGNGIVEYHYPEPNQTDLPRNTRISITFKQPLVLSTIFLDYNDGGTPDPNDDKVNSTGESISETTVLFLNTDNIRLAAIADLADAGSGTIDEQFDNRYAVANANVPALRAKVTPVAVTFDPDERQTLVISPQGLLGSPIANVNYRVALRGGVTGVQVWDLRAGSTTVPIQKSAFARMFVDGAYYWNFATGTSVDVTPPQIEALEPRAVADPSNDLMVRNQLVQVYFSEAIDPTTVSGTVDGQGAGGFANLVMEAQCLSNSSSDCDSRYKAFAPVAGTFAVGNKLRTVEFTPSELCDGISSNSCGEQVFCLPKNVELRVRAVAATVGANAPQAEVDDGIVDMVGNSFDGNGNGLAEGPVSSERKLVYVINEASNQLAGVSDTAEAQYEIGNDIDLIPPQVVLIDPISADENGGGPNFETPYSQGGPSDFPVDKPISITWNKVLAMSSLKTGDTSSATATVILDSTECRKNGTEACTINSLCTCTEVQPPYFYLNAGLPQAVGTTGDGTVLKIEHRLFSTANQLGYTDDDIASFPAGIPRYVPILRAKIKDSRQNCFYPSAGYYCEEVAGKTSCCDRSAQPDSQFSCPPK